MRYRVVLGLLALPLVAAKFYPDDPLAAEPPPLPVTKAQPRKLSDIYDLFSHVFATPGEKQTPIKKIVAGDINTLGEVLNGPWYVKRHGGRRMSLAELAAGPGNSNPPADGEWTVISAKSEGVTPGFLIQDRRGVRYFLKFDPLSNPEIATAADTISSKFFYALGYHVPENYLVNVTRERLSIKRDARFRDAKGILRPLTPKDVGEILLKAPTSPEGQIRATASLVIPGQILAPFRYYGTRADDPNDTVPHEHRRSLRGLHVFAAWLAHDDSRAVNTLDALVEENGYKFVKHYLIDFGSTLGSASFKPNSPRSGFEQFFTWKSSAKEFFSLGLYVPKWSRIDYPDLPSVGLFTAEHFDPVLWTPEYPNPAFENRLPDDIEWAAKQVARFTDEDIRAIVRTGQYSDPAAEKYVAQTIAARRDAIVKAYLRRPLLLEDIRVDGGTLLFSDAGVVHGKLSPPAYRYEWFTFRNESRNRIAGSASNKVPPAEGELVVDVRAETSKRRASIYLRPRDGGHQVIGIDRADE